MNLTYKEFLLLDAILFSIHCNIVEGGVRGYTATPTLHLSKADVKLMQGLRQQLSYYGPDLPRTEYEIPFG